jgi:hypothetical protein
MEETSETDTDGQRPDMTEQRVDELLALTERVNVPERAAAILAPLVAR